MRLKRSKGFIIRTILLKHVTRENFLISAPQVDSQDKKSDHLRLANGGSPCAGRVEVYHDGQWGTVFGLGSGDSGWDMLDAVVVCKELGCGAALSASGDAHFGEGSGPVVTENVQCRGSTQWHLRLESGVSGCDGRVEIFHDGTWGRLLDDSWNISDGDVICRQLNCGSAISVYNSSQYGEGTGPVWINNVQCVGTETHIWNCSHSTVASSSWTSRDVGVICSAEDVQIRLMDGGSSCAGRVEIYYNRTWGTVCDDSWGSLEANVVCKQLGCGSAVHTTSAATCGRASAPVWLDDVRCTGKESALWECPSSPWGQHDCYHKEDVSIVCKEHKMLRLANGLHSCEGRVEVFYNGTWGTVCSDSMGIDEAEVICKQLDCGKALEVEYDGKFDEGSGPIWLDDMECNSKESFLWQCSSRPWGEHNCVHSEDVGVMCSEKAPEKRERAKLCDGRSPDHQIRLSGQELRLVGGSSICSGRVEILSNKTWGTVCDDSWDIREASVVCGQLDCGPAVRAVGQAGFGQGAVQLINIPFVVCIVLGILLAVVLFALIVQMDSNSSGTEEKYPSVRLYQAIYEEIEEEPIRRRSVESGSSVSGSNDSISKLEYYTGESVNGSDAEQGNAEVFLPNDHLQEDYDVAEGGTFQMADRGLLLVTDTHPDVPALTSHTVQEASLCQGKSRTVMS
ncbi:scavenger receptor cysteine-rich type 1 protein M130-like [Callorhinchus milii]|uniref:scavenger receptor cysteine-rich type 1 protein M130-like n=1 Tax=Callorhinchus milii TaxID=7868 RepID=UPI001C3FC46D|nr:scavenger receptor cysteine-rich type 1 protein M130-like [Callorhinchus milii]